MERLMFIGPQRVTDAIISLQFDRNVLGCDHTYIYYGGSKHHRLDSVLQRYNIDTSKFTFLHDTDLPAVSKQYGAWIYQQLLKLQALEIHKGQVLIQDSDSFMLEPYCAFKDNKPQHLVVKNRTLTPADYYDYVQTFLRIERQTPHSFITEFMPVDTTQWHCDIEKLCSMFTKKQIWFSEYELIGNWSYHQGNHDLTFQKKYELNNDVAKAFKKGQMFDIGNSNAVTLTNKDERFDHCDIELLVDFLSK